MLRIYKADLTTDVTVLPEYEPPRPTLRPRTRSTAFPNVAAGAGTFVQYDGGLDAGGRFVRLVSSETQGFLTPAQADALRGMFEAGGAFKIDTDLFRATGGTITYNTFWEVGAVPEFVPVANGTLYIFDLPLRVTEE